MEEEGEEAAEQWAEEEGREEGGYDLYGPPAGRGGAAPGAKARPAPGQAAAESGPAKEGIWFKGRLLNPDDVYDMSGRTAAGEVRVGREGPGFDAFLFCSSLVCNDL